MAENRDRRKKKRDGLTIIHLLLAILQTYGYVFMALRLQKVVDGKMVKNKNEFFFCIK